MKSKVLLMVLILCILLGGCREEVGQTGTSSVATVPSTAEPTTVPSTEAVTEPTAEPTTMPETVATEPPEEPVAERIRDGVRVLIGGNDQTMVTQDGYYLSKCYMGVFDSLVLESAQPFSGLYMVWDQNPGKYTLLWEGGSMECGQYGFLHEYIRLPEAVTRVEVVFETEIFKALCDALFFTEGTAPEGIHDWLPPCEEADVLVFPTHSDDDVLFFGALISDCILGRGLTVQTAFMVDHMGYPERGHERLNGLWEMGVRYYPILGSAPDTGIRDFNDGMYYYKSSNIEQWQVEQIRRFKPLVVIGHDLDGEYGNAGHKVNAHFLTTAMDAAANPEAYPESAATYGVWNAPKMYLHLYPENEITLEVNVPLEGDPLGRTAFEVAEDAIQCHVSQLRWVQVQQGLSRAYDCRFFGLYRSLVGSDTGADIMENIDPVQWRTAP